MGGSEKLRTSPGPQAGDGGSLSEPTILVADDDPTVRQALISHFMDDERLSDCRFLQAATLPEVKSILAADKVHVLILDKQFEAHGDTPASDGIEAIAELLSLNPDLQILVFSGADDTQTVVKAMRLGAAGYFSKREHPTLMNTQIAKTLQIAAMASAKTLCERGGRLSTGGMKLPGNSRAIRKLQVQLEAVADSDRPVILLGEPGVGKTTVAFAIHEQRCVAKKQTGRPFYAINPCAMSEQIIDRELFGNEKGAFTGAFATRPGFFDLVRGGTLFIDELGDIPLSIQVKLLKVLEEGKYYRVGGTKELTTHFKLVCATNKNLEELVKQGKFREDLYMRISTFQVRIPSIRERKEDIPQLVESLLPKACRDAHIGIAFEDIPKSFISALMKRPPNGNIRGLENMLSYLLTFCPKDHLGRPHLERWRAIEELSHLAGESQTAAEQSNGGIEHLTLDDLVKRPFDVVCPDFPGLTPMLELVRRKLVDDALTKFPKQQGAAQALRTSKGNLSRLITISGARSAKLKGSTQEQSS